MTVVGTGAAATFPMDNITGFLYLIGSVFAPMIAIQITDYFLLGKDRSRDAYCVSNLLIWLAGFILYRFLMQVDTPVGNTLPDMAATMALTYACHKVCSKDTGNVNVMKM